ncbi:hypothetical protein RI367_004275 [Sorochytrium milnesiophthora]
MSSARDQQRCVYLITGCSPGGLGHGLAVELAKNANNIVVATLRTPSKIGATDPLRAKQAANRGVVDILKLDVINEQEVTDVVSKVVQKHGKIDCLVNNSGVQLFDVNYFGSVNMVREVFPHMAGRRSGKIVNVGSVAAWHALPWSSHYAASKAALHTWSDALRSEVKPFNIQVLTVAPGAIDSNIQENHREQLSLSPNTKYSDWKTSIYGYLDVGGLRQTKTDDFSRRFAAVVQRNKVPVEWSYGRMSTIVWLLTWLPRWLVAFINFQILNGGITMNKLASSAKKTE